MGIVAAAGAAAQLNGQPVVVPPSSPYAGLAAGSADGSGSAAGFFNPKGVAVDSGGNIYIADTLNDTIRKLSPGGGVVTIAGSAGTSGVSDGQGTAALFFNPSAIAVDAQGNLYVADTPNQLIREISPSGKVTTLAGVPGTAGSVDGPAASAEFYNPGGVAVDGSGDVYVADTYNDTIRMIAGGQVTTIAGQPGVAGSNDGAARSAHFDSPNDLRVDAAGDIYVADTGNHTIRLIANGQVTTLAGTPGVSGSADGPAASAQFFDPEGLAIANGRVYVADTGNHTIRVIANGSVSTLAGLAGAPGAANGPAAFAQFDGPQSVEADAAGNLWVADTGNNAIREISAAGTVTTAAGPVGASRLVNLSIRAVAGPGAAALTAGFVIGGSGSKSLLIRGDGPALSQYDVSDPLPNPELTLYQGTGALQANAGWDDNPQVAQVGTAVGAFALPAGSADAALVVSLGSGSYTASVTPASGSNTGVALAELYDADTGSPPARLVNVSARDAVTGGQAILVAGFVVSGNMSETLLVRAIGPTLATYGVPDPLSATQLTVYDSQGAALASNSGWSGASLSAAFADTDAFSLPAGSADSALLVTLPPGVYTAQANGAGGATGEGLVEVYEVTHP